MGLAIAEQSWWKRCLSADAEAEHLDIVDVKQQKLEIVDRTVVREPNNQ